MKDHKNRVFDMGGVLVRFEPKYFIERLGYTGEDARLLLREVFVTVEWAALDHGAMDEDEAFERCSRRLPERLRGAARELIFAWDEPILPMPGMAERLEELKSSGHKLYLLSNASRRQHEYWPRVPGSEYFDGTLISADCRLIKPQPEIYRELYRKFLLDPADCFFTDDNPQNVEAAIATGMYGEVFREN